jgi:hypothetical protein
MERTRQVDQKRRAARSLRAGGRPKAAPSRTQGLGTVFRRPASSALPYQCSAASRRSSPCGTRHFGKCRMARIYLAAGDVCVCHHDRVGDRVPVSLLSFGLTRYWNRVRACSDGGTRTRPRPLPRAIFNQDQADDGSSWASTRPGCFPS